jgi:hypothetical protein
VREVRWKTTTPFRNVNVSGCPALSRREAHRRRESAAAA